MCFQLRPTLWFDSSVRLYVLDRFNRNNIESVYRALAQVSERYDFYENEKGR